jgi:hypothetical protein
MFFRHCSVMGIGHAFAQGVELTCDLSMTHAPNTGRIGQQKNRACGAVVIVIDLGCNGLAGWFQDDRD